MRFFLFIMVQVYVLNKIPHLHQFITPYIYFLFLLWLPFSISRIGLLITGFITGMALDFFTMTPGLHAAACVLLAYARPFIINILTPKDSSEFNYREPSPKSAGLDTLSGIRFCFNLIASWLFNIAGMVVFWNIPAISH